MPRSNLCLFIPSVITFGSIKGSLVGFVVLRVGDIECNIVPEHEGEEKANYKNRMCYFLDAFF